MSRLAVAVIGVRGRLGGFAAALLAGRDDFDLVGGYDREDDWRRDVAESGALVALEATVAGRGCAHGLALLDAGVRPVIGTSGVSLEECERLDRRSRELGLGGLVVPNFSLGALLLQRFAEQGVRHFPDAEIIELHHERKADAPSGTAAQTARRIAAARSQPPRTPRRAEEPRDRGGFHADVPVHSVRLPGFYAHQEVLLGAPGETLSLRHDMLGPEAFAAGILAALRYAAAASGVACGLEHALE